VDDNKKSFWTSLPAILTGVAAIIAAIGGIIVVHPFHPGGTASGQFIVEFRSIRTAATITWTTTTFVCMCSVCSVYFLIQIEPVYPNDVYSALILRRLMRVY